MDICKLEKASGKQSTAETRGKSLVSADNKNGTTRRSQTREVSSRYRSTSPSPANGSRRCPSPIASRTSPTSTVLVPKRSVSAERKRPSTPSSPQSRFPSTPVQDTMAEMLLTSRKTGKNKLAESLWPSTMRSLNSSFQSDSGSLPIGKRENAVSHMFSDCALMPSLNVSRKRESTIPRKATLEGKSNPLKGKISADQLENSKPVDSINTRLLDQHRWPSLTSEKKITSMTRSVIADKIEKISFSSHCKMGKVSPRMFSLNRPIKNDLDGKVDKTSTLHPSSTGTSSLRRLSLAGATKPLNKFANDLLMTTSWDDHGKEIVYGHWVDDCSPCLRRPSSSRSSDRFSVVNVPDRIQNLAISGLRLRSPSVSRGLSPVRVRASNPPSSSSSSDRSSVVFAADRTQSLPISGSCLQSPSVSRGLSPIRVRPSNPSSRVTSPTRIRPSSPSRIMPSSPSRIAPSSPTRIRLSSPSSQLQSSTSVLSFVADVNDKMDASFEDVHQLRLLHSRYFQWRFLNARAGATLCSHKVKSEKIFYSMWRLIVDLIHLLAEERSEHHKLTLKLKLYSVLDSQVICLNEWASLEKQYTTSLIRCIQDLKACTFLIPVARGAKGNTKSVKEALCSAVKVMQATGSSLCYTLSKVQEMQCRISELANVTAHERAMLDECELLLGSTSTLQVEESFLRSLVLQMKQG